MVIFSQSFLTHTLKRTLNTSEQYFSEKKQKEQSKENVLRDTEGYSESNRFPVLDILLFSVTWRDLKYY